MYRLVSPSVFLLVSAVGLGATYSYYESVSLGETARLTSLAEQAAHQVVARVGNHVSLLQATKALYSANDGSVSVDAFRAFVAGLDLSGEYRGVQGIGFSKVLREGDAEKVTADLARDYGIERAPWPESTEDLKTSITALEPSNPRNAAALGYDMYSNETRREAMKRAGQTGEASASGPVMLVQEITDDKQAGFLVYLPWYASGQIPSETDQIRLEGFIYAPFRAGDLHQAALQEKGELPLLVETFDATGNEMQSLFRSGGFEERVADSGPKVIVSAEVAGREWLFNIYPTRDFSNPGDYYPVYAAGLGVLLLAVLAAALTHVQFRAGIAARNLADATRKGLEEKELMLQEMKHRLKNAIARIAAIARQTSANSEDLEEFSSSFQARLNSMANAQDMLTRSQWSKADLKSLLSSELEQVLGSDVVSSAVDGTSVEVNEKATQALGLVFHELATNALKYGAVTDPDGSLKVSWTIEGTGKKKQLVIDWVEQRPAIELPETARKGFGTRLIDLYVTIELSGVIERVIEATETRVLIRLPFASWA
ncbi:CHASE domain-containing protein [Roseibium sp.]|uniref:CHASE domain-containing protein n=1 Tax=Roseibium sp. TaxID=1936156 RepID=UPI003A98698C